MTAIQNDTHREQWLLRATLRSRAILTVQIIAVLIPVIGIVGWTGFERIWQAKDTAGSPVLSGTGILNQLTLAKTGTTAWVQFQGHLQPAPYTSSALLLPGQRVRVEYQIGRSGRTYLERVIPLTP